MKRTVSIVVAALVIVLIIISIVEPDLSKKLTSDMRDNSYLSTEQSSAPYSTNVQYKNPQFGDIVKMQISDDKLASMNTFVLIEEPLGNRILEYCVDSVYYSSVLADDYAPKKSYLQYFGADIMGEDGTLLRDWYYVYADITVRNAGDSVVELIPNNTELIFIDDDKMATDEINLKKSSYYYTETSNNKRYNELNFISDFQPGEVSSYQQVFIVPEIEVENNDVYLRAPYGNRGEHALGNKNQRYIHLELEGRKDATGTE